MNGFRLVSIILSMLLGLGVTQLLSNLVTLFLSRRKVKIRVVPLLWVVSTLVLQLQFWWAVNELEALIQKWSFRMFIVALLLPLSLFLAAAVVLPKKEIDEESDLAELFERDGRWGLVGLAAYGVLAIFANYDLFGASPWSIPTAVMGSQAALAVAYVCLKSDRSKAIVSVAHLAVALVATTLLSPKEY